SGRPPARWSCRSPRWARRSASTPSSGWATPRSLPGCARSSPNCRSSPPRAMCSSRCGHCATSGNRPGTKGAHMSAAVSNTALQRWLAFAVIGVVLLASWLILRRLITPIVWAAVLAFLMHPLQRRLTRRFGDRPSAAAGVITGLTPVAIVVPLMLLALAFAEQVTTLTAKVEGGGAGLFDLAAWMDPLQHPRIASTVEWVAERFDLRVTEVREQVRDGTRDSVNVIAK